VLEFAAPPARWLVLVSCTLPAPRGSNYPMNRSLVFSFHSCGYVNLSLSLSLSLSQHLMADERMEHWWSRGWQEKTELWEGNIHSSTFSAANPTWIALGLIPDLRCQKRAINRPNGSGITSNIGFLSCDRQDNSTAHITVSDWYWLSRSVWERPEVTWEFSQGNKTKGESLFRFQFQ
jgi:hypothetical protein